MTFTNVYCKLGMFVVLQLNNEQLFTYILCLVFDLIFEVEHCKIHVALACLYGGKDTPAANHFPALAGAGRLPENGNFFCNFAKGKAVDSYNLSSFVFIQSYLQVSVSYGNFLELYLFEIYWQFFRFLFVVNFAV